MFRFVSTYRQLMMKQLLSFLLVSIWISLQASFAQGFFEVSAGGRMAGLGHAYSAITGDLWTQFSNPAGLAGLEQAALGASGNQIIGLTQLGSAQLAGGWSPIKGQGIGGFVHRRGWEAWGETRAGVSYGIEVLGRLRLGAGADWVQISAAGYGMTNLLQANAGMQLDLTRNLAMGVAVQNATQAGLVDVNGNRQQTLATSLVGLSYQPSEKVLLTGEAVIQAGFAPLWRTGLEYQVAEILYVRLGGTVGTGITPAVSAGAGLYWKQFEFDLATTFGTEIGYSPTLSIAYQLAGPSSD
ncbi:MAG: hypothetical protein AAFV07_03110 [Bacteroidota bacterium]